MLMMRLQRVGRKHDPSYRLVVTEKDNGPKSGNFVEIIGNYNPRKEKPENLEVKAERVSYWLGVGVQPSDTVYNLLVDKGIISGKKKAVHSSKNAGKEAADAKSSGEPKEAAASDAAKSDGDDAPIASDATPAKESKEEVAASDAVPADADATPVESDSTESSSEPKTADAGSSGESKEENKEE